ncbi:hypothetical protein llap_15919 [Limosa lapponica baueri]|uniref:Uncharacterized protein n=1 Tax=Limosa lapponica baueri TaxID=1758121 RepID=A0A2I0TIY2_LIMLA|nr:hypothetical protein llap_15919 [Limosa lapponica baueri]
MSLGACLSCAQQEAKDAPAPNRISAVEYATLKSENEVLKSSLAFERETREKLGTRVDQLLNENGPLKQLLGKVNRRLDTMQPSALVKQIRRLMHNPNFETHTEDIWSDSNDDGKGTAPAEGIAQKLMLCVLTGEKGREDLKLSMGKWDEGNQTLSMEFPLMGIGNILNQQKNLFLLCIMKCPMIEVGNTLLKVGLLLENLETCYSSTILTVP